jgi:hypothetical protein
VAGLIARSFEGFGIRALLSPWVTMESSARGTLRTKSFGQQRLIAKGWRLLEMVQSTTANTETGQVARLNLRNVASIKALLTDWRTKVIKKMFDAASFSTVDTLILLWSLDKGDK